MPCSYCEGVVFLKTIKIPYNVFTNGQRFILLFQLLNQQFSVHMRSVFSYFLNIIQAETVI